jgi:hypothetical protein
VAGGALAPDGHWQATKPGFLFPTPALSPVFRAKFLDAVDEARRHGRLQREPALSALAWPRLRADLLRHHWVVYAKQPPGGPAQVLEYLGRYTHRVAISNERILGVRDGQVLFRVRAGEPGQGKKRVVRSGTEFVRRFLLHVLPPGFKRIRHYGLLASNHKAGRLALWVGIYSDIRPASADCRDKSRPSALVRARIQHGGSPCRSKPRLRS